MTRVMLIHPGASFSTHDVWAGLEYGLKANDVEIINYRLDRALGVSQALVAAAIEQDVLDSPVDVFGLATSEAIAAAVHYEPDVIIVVSGGNVPPMRAAQFAKLAQQRLKPLTTVLYDTESPYATKYLKHLARHFDLVLTNERTSLEAFDHPNVRYVSHAYHPDAHYPRASDPEHDVSFIGTGFPERQALFDAIDWAGIDFLKLGVLWGDHDHPNTINPTSAVANTDTAHYYRTTRININHHRTSTIFGTGEHISERAYSLGPRAYEIAACGAFQLCDDSRQELFDVFGDTIPTYRAGDAADLSDKIRYYLDRPEERAARAADALARVQPHAWPVRAADILAMCADSLAISLAQE